MFTMAGDGRGLRHPAGEPQPGAVRPEEARGDQRRAHAAAQHRGARAAAGARSCRRPTSSRTRRRRRRPSRSPRACVLIHERSARSARAPTCWRSCSSTRSSTTHDRRRQAARRATGSRSSTPPATRWPRVDRLDDRRHRGGPARQARRRARAQAAQRVRPRAGRHHRPAGLAAAVRVAGAARSRARRWRGSTQRRGRRTDVSGAPPCPPQPALGPVRRRRRGTPPQPQYRRRRRRSWYAEQQRRRRPAAGVTRTRSRAATR